MMWLSQLAYETADQSKVKDILKAWQLKMHKFIANNPTTGLPPDSACVVVAAGHGATFVTFAGSDPLKFEDWITDFDAAKSATDVHKGFQQTVGKVWPDVEAGIKTAIAGRPASEQALFFTGHSLGGALAIVAATRASATPEFKNLPTTVYTFGGPRIGGAEFFSEYPLHDSTFRLIHGTDIVATVPAAQPGDYRHVGRSVQCQTGGLFLLAANKNGGPANKTPVIEENRPWNRRYAIRCGAVLDQFFPRGRGVCLVWRFFCPR